MRSVENFRGGPMPMDLVLIGMRFMNYPEIRPGRFGSEHFITALHVSRFTLQAPISPSSVTSRTNSSPNRSPTAAAIRRDSSRTSRAVQSGLPLMMMLACL